MSFRRLKECEAYAISAGGDKFITLPIDFDDDYTLRYLLHELCHLALPGELGAFGKLEEEIIIRVLEPFVFKHLLDNPKKHSWWLNQLATLRTPT